MRPRKLIVAPSSDGSKGASVISLARCWMGRRSGDGMALVVARIAPNLAADAIAQQFGGVPDIDEAEIGRREAEPYDVGRAEIADPAAFDHRLHDGIAFVESDRDLAAAQRRLTRRQNREFGQQRCDAGDEKIGQSEALAPEIGNGDIAERIERSLDAA